MSNAPVQVQVSSAFVPIDRFITSRMNPVNSDILEEVQHGILIKHVLIYVDSDFHLLVEVFESGRITIEERDGSKITTYLIREYIKSKDALRSIKNNIPDIEQSPREWKKCLKWMLIC